MGPFDQGGTRGPEAWAAQVTASCGESGRAAPQSGAAWSLGAAPPTHPPPPLPCMLTCGPHVPPSNQLGGGSLAQPAPPPRLSQRPGVPCPLSPERGGSRPQVPTQSLWAPGPRTTCGRTAPHTGWPVGRSEKGGLAFNFAHGFFSLWLKRL